MVKRIVTVGLGLLFAAAAYSQAPELARMDIVLKSLPDGPVARVQGTSIGRQEFARLYEAEREQLSRERGSTAMSDVDRAQLAMAVIRSLVERALLYNQALERELTVPEESVRKAWNAQLAPT